LQDNGEGIVRVFVVEESTALSRRLVERLVETPGITVIGTARTVIDAVRKIVVLHPDLVITDLDLAEGGGFALLDALRIVRYVEGCGPTVILWTGCRDPLRQARARELGAQVYFDKAREMELLVDYCRNAASQDDPGIAVTNPERRPCDNS
jgi:DNA-binding NarL/FixJ family response regulator